MQKIEVILLLKLKIILKLFKCPSIQSLLRQHEDFESHLSEFGSGVELHNSLFEPLQLCPNSLTH